MGKDRPHKHTLSFAKNSRTVWNGILEIVEFHRWPRVKKVLPNRRHGIVRPEIGDGIQISSTDPVFIEETHDIISAEACCVFETDHTCPTTPTKRSKPTQMKALIAQEMVQDDGRRRRSTTYPLRSQLKRTLSFHHIEPATSCDVTSDGVCEIPSGKNGGNAPPQVENDLEIFGSSEDLAKEKPQLSNSTNLVDAANVVSMKNDTFFKILEDRRYPLFYQMHDGGMVELTKCESFRIPGSSGRHDSRTWELDKPEGGEESREQMAEIGSKSYGPGVTYFPEVNEKERRRISLDAVFHRIPHGDQFSTESLSKDRIKDATFSSSRTVKHHMKRTSSLVESLDRFSQLFPNTRVEQENFSGNAARKKMGRIYSSPNLPTPLCSNADDSGDPSLDNHETDDAETYPSYSAPLQPEYEITENLEVDHLDQSLPIISTEAKSSLCERDVYTTMFSSEDVLDPYIHEDDVDVTLESTSKGEHVESISKCLLLHDLNSLGDKASAMDTLRVLEEGEQEENAGLSTFEVGVEYEQEFDYIRELLQVSGFVGNGGVGAWHSPDQPLDPFLFDKLEGYFATGTGDEGEERKSRFRMLLFDVVNEMLVDHYDRSFTYCPVPPSPALLPDGYRLLEKLWGDVRWLLSFRPEMDPTLDAITCRDVVKDKGWMHLQFEKECVCLQVEELILDHLMDEIFST